MDKSIIFDRRIQQMTRTPHIQHNVTDENPLEYETIHHSQILRCSMFLVQCSVFIRPYLVFNEQGYSKHYYAGAERVSSRVGGGMQDALVDPLNYTVEILSGQDYTAMAGDLQDMLGRNIECTDMPMQYVSMEQRLGSIEESKNHNNTEDNRYIYHSDHLGSSSFLTDVSGNPTQHLQYLPFGEPFIEQRSVTDYYTPYTFSAKERDLETGYSYFGARYYNSHISVWLSVDPLSDKYPSMSPYMYCAGNPVMLVDPDGMAFVDFDENGNFIEITKDNFFHNLFHGMKGRIIDADGSVKETFKFSDPKNDVADIRKGILTSIVTVKEIDVIKMISRAGGFWPENKTQNRKETQRYDYILSESTKDGKMDFSRTQIPRIYPDASINPLVDPSSMMFLIDAVAYNHNNFGNFLWGAAGQSLGYFLFELRGGAHFRSATQGGEDGYPSQLDSRDDQKAIKKGYRFAQDRKYDKRFWSVNCRALMQIRN